MIGIPWMLAFALRDTGWYLRNDIIWMKDNPMPESVKDRCARCYEHIFLFSKSKKYFFDYKAISEPIAPATAERIKRGMKGGNKYGKPVPGQPQPQSINRPREHGEIKDADINPLRNKRDVWKINTVPFKGGHYAAYPPKLVETCLLAGCPEGGIVLDPFMGSGTTGMVASQMGRHFVGIELNPAYTELATSGLEVKSDVQGTGTQVRDKVVVRMTREGAVEENLTAGTEQRVSKRLEDAELVKPVETADPSKALSAEEQKKVQMRRQQHQFQAEHAEDNNTQRPRKRPSQKRKRQKIHPRTHPNRCPCQRLRSSLLLWSSTAFLLIPAR